MKTFLSLLLSIAFVQSHSQYIAVRARYTETRLVDDSPNPPKRENRLILSFYTVTFNGTENVFSPAVLSDYDIWVYRQGLQYGNVMGGVLDSTGNNYPGYAYPAPKAVSYYNTLGLNYIDCDPNAATHYVVNGHELDCGFITVSYWDMDWGTMQPIECFPAPNICLPYYDFIHPYYWAPGNVNFGFDVFPGPPYNLYNFDCGGPLQLVRRGLLSYDSSGAVVLPVRFAGVRADIDANDRVTISWSNMTESDIAAYEIESSIDGSLFQVAGTVMPTANNGGRADYTFYTIQTAERVFYRVKAVESSGTVLYTNVMIVKRTVPTGESPKTLLVYPNPVRGTSFSIRLSGAVTGRYVCSIINNEGRQVRHKMIGHTGGDLVRDIDMNGLSSGIYQVLLWSSDSRYSQTVVYGY